MGTHQMTDQQITDFNIENTIRVINRHLRTPGVQLRVLISKPDDGRSGDIAGVLAFKVHQEASIASAHQKASSPLIGMGGSDTKTSSGGGDQGSEQSPQSSTPNNDYTESEIGRLMSQILDVALSDE